MDSLSTILGDKGFNEPMSVGKLKQYIESAFESDCKIKVGPKGLTIIVKSSALANTIRLQLPQIKRELDIKENLNIRIG